MSSTSRSGEPVGVDLIDQLDLTPDACQEVLVEAIALHRGRPLSVKRMTLDLPDTRHGVWIATDEADHLIITSTAGPGAVIHDLVHVLCGHTTPTPGTREVVYTLDQEREAALIAERLISAYPNLIAA